MEIVLLQEWVWLGGVVGFKTKCPHMGPGPTGGVPSGNLLIPKESQPVFSRVSEKTTENSERLGQQVRPKIEPGTSHLPVRAQNHLTTGGAQSLGYTYICIYMHTSN